MKIRTFTTTAVAVLAIAAPTAQAAMLGADQASSPSAASYYTPAALRALALRYDAMSAAYSRHTVPTVVAQPQANPFSWGDAALGAGAAMLILAALVGSVRLSSLTRDAQQSLRTS